MTQKAKQRNGKVTSASATAMPLEDVAAAAEHMNSVRWHQQQLLCDGKQKLQNKSKENWGVINTKKRVALSTASWVGFGAFAGWRNVDGGDYEEFKKRKINKKY